jgi:hypothetical protein
VTIDIVENDDVIRFQGVDEFGPDIGLARFGVDRNIEHPGCLDTFVAQRADEGHGVPTSMRHMGDQPLAPRTPAAMLILIQVSSMKTMRRGSNRSR